VKLLVNRLKQAMADANGSWLLAKLLSRFFLIILCSD
jgi:hypothetical protein